MKALLFVPVLLLCHVLASGQITYDYYKNPDKIGSSNPKATEYFIRSFEFIMQWGDKDTDSAIYYMLKAIEEDSLYAIAYASLGHMLRFQGYDGTVVDNDSANRLADIALEVDPKCADALTLKSRIHAMNNELQEAIDLAKMAVEAEPDHRETWFWVGLWYSQIPEKLDSAIFYFEKTLVVDPEFGQPHQKLGFLYLEQKQEHDKAAYHFRQMIRLYEEFAPKDERMIVGYQGVALALSAEGRYDHAIDTVNILLEKLDTSDLLWRDQLKAWAYRVLINNYSAKAKITLEQYIALKNEELEEHERDPGIMSNYLGEMLEQQNKLQQWDLEDTINQILEPLVEEMLKLDDQESYIMYPALYAKITRLHGNMDLEESRIVINEQLDRFKGKEDLVMYIYYFSAINCMEMEEPEAAIRYLSQAIESGFSQAVWLEGDSAFSSIRDTPEFRELVEQIK